jgi:hypothetical protein
MRQQQLRCFKGGEALAAIEALATPANLPAIAARRESVTRVSA